METFQQWYKVAKFNDKKHRDIALKEYETCSKIMENGENIFNNLIKYIIAFWTIITWLISSSNYQVLLKNIIEYDKNFQMITLIIIIFVLFILLTIDFAKKQKNVVFAKRKIIVIRNMLGLSYENQQLILAKNEIYGEDNPFNIKLKFDFNFIFILILFALSIIIVGVMLEVNIKFSLYCSGVSISLLTMIYLYNIEQLAWSLIFFISKILFVDIKDDYENILYRAKLSVYEAKRLKINLEYLKKFLIFIEDKNFKLHKGIDYKAMIRALISNIKFLNKIIKKITGKELAASGGSTITQQLFRTLFIKNMSRRKICRKIVEIIASRFWLNRKLSKEEQLDIYLCSVRFDKNVFGIIEAKKHFFNNKTGPNKVESFFLIERISVISGKILPKTKNIIKTAHKERLLNDNEIKALEKIYNEKIGSIKIN